ncbi:MAG: alkaline phosphatase family protein [Longimicrobiales bacterium]
MLVGLLVLGLFLGSPLAVQSQDTRGATQRITPKVLVIGIDGVRPDVLETANTPNIDALAREGFFTDRAQTGFPTVSGPGWSSFLNGVWPAKHGVTDNSFEGARYQQHPDFLTRLEQLDPSLNTFAVANWTPLFQSPPEAPLIGLAVDDRHILDGSVGGWSETDEVATGLAVQAIQTDQPDALFVYLGNPDETSHHNGDIGPLYREAIEVADSHVGRLVEAVRGRATAEAENWLILISTDHGRTEAGGHGGPSPEEKTIFFLAHGPEMTQAESADPVHIVDVAVTALAHMGVALDPAWGLDGRIAGLAR